jgi:HYR domain
MRNLGVAVVVFLFSISAFGGTITSIDPGSIVVGSGEYFLTITGTDLGDFVRYSGPGGTYDIEISARTGTGVIAWVPLEVIGAVGLYDVTVLGGPTGDSNTVTLEITDGSGTPTFVVLVPDTMTVPVQGLGGSVVTFDVTTYGGSDPNPTPVNCTPASGSLFPVGTTTVFCSATNSFGEYAENSFTVTVQDIEPPVLTLPGNMTVAATDASGAVVTYSATAYDAAEGSVPVSCAPSSGSLFPLGVTTVTCTAVDSSLNEASGTFDVNVTDQTAPSIASVTASPNLLQPANKKFTTVNVSVAASDNVDPTPQCSIVNVTSSQPIAGDWTITGPLSVSLRAERTGNVDRVYQVNVSCSDDAGNTSNGSVNVTVKK